MPMLKDAVQNVKDTALEVGIYLPLGAYSKVRDQVGDLDTRKVKRFYGNLVDRGQERLEPLERSAKRRGRQVERRAAEKADELSRDAERTARRARGMAKETVSETSRAARKTGARAGASADALAPKLPRVATPKSPKDLPIDNYENLTANEIARATKGLTQTDLAKLYKYERANQDRATVLEAVEAKFVALPIPSYDALTADEINARLANLGESELKKIRGYENDTKKRTTILERIDSLLGATV